MSCREHFSAAPSCRDSIALEGRGLCLCRAPWGGPGSLEYPSKRPAFSGTSGLPLADCTNIEGAEVVLRACRVKNV